MVDTDAAVLRAVEGTLLNPRVVERALAQAEALILADGTGEQRRSLESQLAETGVAIRRLTSAIAQGGELAPLVAALDTHERQRKDLENRLASLSAPRLTLDAEEVRRTLRGYLADWQKLLSGHVHQAQQIVRRLVKERLTMTPQTDGFYTFSGTGTVRPLLAGVRNMASPRGVENFYVVSGSAVRAA